LIEILISTPKKSQSRQSRPPTLPFTYCYHSVIAISLKELFHSQSYRIKGVRLTNILCLWIDELIMGH
jgi:hypothetical protein